MIDQDTTFVYIAEDESHTGTIEDYASALQSAHYCGFSVLPSVYVWNATELRFDVRTPVVNSTGYNEDDYSSTTITLDNATATFRIDGRA